MYEHEIVPGAPYRHGKTVRRVRDIEGRRRVSFIVSVDRDKRGRITRRGGMTFDDVGVVPVHNKRGGVVDRHVVVGGVERALEATEELRSRREGGTVVCTEDGETLKRMPIARFAAWAEARAD